MIESEIKEGMPVRIADGKCFADGSLSFTKLIIERYAKDSYPFILYTISLKNYYGTHREFDYGIKNIDTYMEKYQYDPYGKLCFELREITSNLFDSYAENTAIIYSKKHLYMSTETYKNLMEDINDCKILSQNTYYHVSEENGIKNMPIMLVQDNNYPIFVKLPKTLLPISQPIEFPKYACYKVSIDENLGLGVVKI